MSEETKKTEEQTGFFKMDFSNFVLSLNASALIHLGEIHDPQTKERAVNMQAAKQTIDILEILKNKTKGNLDNEEEKLLNEVLYNIRMKFMSEKK